MVATWERSKSLSDVTGLSVKKCRSFLKRWDGDIDEAARMILEESLPICVDVDR